MATIINDTSFTKAELKLAIDNIAAQDYIDEHEPIILKKLLGYSLSNEFTTALAGTPAAKWLSLRDGGTYTDGNGNVQSYEGIQKIIADYVYVQIVADLQSQATQTGVTKSEKENAIQTNPRYRQVFANTDMVNRVYFLNGFINAANDADDTTYENYDPTPQTKGNVFNI